MSSMSVKLGGLTTSQIYDSLKNAYNQQHIEIATTCSSIDQQRSEVDTRYAALNSERVSPPQQNMLKEEYNRYFAVFTSLAVKKEGAVALERDLHDGMEYLNRPPLQVDTMETIRRNNPDLYAQVQKDYENCMKSFRSLKEWWGQISVLRERMDGRLSVLGTSLKYFNALVENGGKPLPFYSLGLTALFSAPTPQTTTSRASTSSASSSSSTSSSSSQQPAVKSGVDTSTQTPAPNHSDSAAVTSTSSSPGNASSALPSSTVSNSSGPTLLPLAQDSSKSDKATATSASSGSTTSSSPQQIPTVRIVQINAHPVAVSAPTDSGGHSLVLTSSTSSSSSSPALPSKQSKGAASSGTSSASSSSSTSSSSPQQPAGKSSTDSSTQTSASSSSSTSSSSPQQPASKSSTDGSTQTSASSSSSTSSSSPQQPASKSSTDSSQVSAASRSTSVAVTSATSSSSGSPVLSSRQTTVNLNALQNRSDRPDDSTDYKTRSAEKKTS
jgi:hypothetical protein